MPTEQQRPDVQAARLAWREMQKGLDPKRLVFIDETWASTNMTPRYGRCERGKRLLAYTPFGHWKTTTFVAALRCDRITAPCVFDGPINGETLATSSSWIISVPIKSPAFRKPSKPPGRRRGFCLPTALTSILSNRFSPSSKTHCGKWPTEPSTPFGKASASPSMTFLPTNV